VLGDARLAAAAALLFVFNPASVFHAAAYSEAPFFAATVLGLWALYVARSSALAAAAFAASSAVRSNGARGGRAGTHSQLGASAAQQGLTSRPALGPPPAPPDPPPHLNPNSNPRPHPKA
jgi:hypothetical protein